MSRYDDKACGIEVLLGLTLAKCVREDGAGRGGDQIRFVTTDGRTFIMDHAEDCCESVEIEDINGDLADLVGAPILVAESPSSEGTPSNEAHPESFTWTFYKLATAKGHVVIRWYGSSNGYYSESVDFREVPRPDAEAGAP